MSTDPLQARFAGRADCVPGDAVGLGSFGPASGAIASRLRVLLSMAALISAFLGCASGRVSDLAAYEEVPMDRVVPYPSQAELAKRAYELVLVDRPAVGIDEAELEAPRAQVRRALEAIAADAGAVVIDRSLGDLEAVRTEGELAELGGEAPRLSGADFALLSRFNVFRHSAAYEPPFRFLWQTEEDVADEPGTCSHLVEVAFDVQVAEIGDNDRIGKTYALEHAIEEQLDEMSPDCPIDPVLLGVFFERVIAEAIGCIELPLQRFLSPRGHVSAHRKAPEADRHLYRISLGSSQGIAAGDEIEFRREQHSSRPSGERSRRERVIATGRVTDKVMEEHAWAVVERTAEGDEILDGDVVRPVVSEGLLASLSGPSCGGILTEH